MTLARNIVLFGVLCAAGLAQAQLLTPVWTEVGEKGVIARIVVASHAACPAIAIDGKTQPMLPRLPVPDGLSPACESTIPVGTVSAYVGEKKLALPAGNPSKVVVIGDTGCRVKGAKTQDCNDPAKWPFRGVSTKAAAANPDLVIHVGDYLYREDACPANALAQCDGPAGDNWPAWNADFFAPAADLLAAAPWVFARGNHESCDRSWRGWFYYLDPRPFTGACDAFSPPYPVKLGGLELVMFDSASASDKDIDPKNVARYQAELAGLHPQHAWLVLHHPIWGLKVAASGAAGAPPSETFTEVTAAWEKSPPVGIDLIVSGHTHLFELLTFDHNRPTQLVAGDGGTELAMPLPAKLAGLKLRDATLLSGEDAHEFGYTSLVRQGASWWLSLTNLAGRVIESAAIPTR